MSRNAIVQKSLLLAATFLCLVSAFTLGGNASAAETTGSDRTVYVNGIGTIKVKPDTAMVNVNINFMVTGTAKDAQEKNTEVINNLVLALNQEGVKQADLIPMYFNMYPIYNPMPMPIEGEQPMMPNEPQKSNGFQIDQQLQVETHNLDKITEIMTKINTVENVAAQGVNYSLENVDQYLDQARVKAAQDAKKKATALGNVFNFTLGDILTISENSYYDPYGGYGGGYGGGGNGGLGLPPRDIDVRLDLNVTYELTDGK